MSLTLTALTALQTSQTSKQKMISAATIQEGSTAQIVAENLYQEILNYQANLPDTEDVAMSVVSFNQTTTILVDSINFKAKNSSKAKYGWYRYLTRFALPVVNEDSVITHYNIYLATLIVRIDQRKKLHLYDLIHVKKESSFNFIL